jgi:hypothetical protein
MRRSERIKGQNKCALLNTADAMVSKTLANLSRAKISRPNGPEKTSRNTRSSRPVKRPAEESSRIKSQPPIKKKKKTLSEDALRTGTGVSSIHEAKQEFKKGTLPLTEEKALSAQGFHRSE